MPSNDCPTKKNLPNSSQKAENFQIYKPQSRSIRLLLCMGLVPVAIAATVSPFWNRLFDAKLNFVLYLILYNAFRRILRIECLVISWVSGTRSFENTRPAAYYDGPECRPFPPLFYHSLTTISSQHLSSVQNLMATYTRMLKGIPMMDSNHP